ncbi:hypothetical protein BP00DRAFT_31105 [Aspergillus indologenus CBS 114.80]|uniref:Uncharacterized protein n=1 Tax=Aspergillus indologenus CBS 114.80 TaxID=1450541 RepID=A0A2V5HTQ2_9EURO|nr:hypothetical protein BP00DRAFT_31105 [Aspergillus indologenus CBS 114.80]
MSLMDQRENTAPRLVPLPPPFTHPSPPPPSTFHSEPLLVPSLASLGIGDYFPIERRRQPELDSVIRYDALVRRSFPSFAIGDFCWREQDEREASAMNRCPSCCLKPNSHRSLHSMRQFPSMVPKLFLLGRSVLGETGSTSGSTRPYCSLTPYLARLGTVDSGSASRWVNTCPIASILLGKTTIKFKSQKKGGHSPHKLCQLDPSFTSVVSELRYEDK